jgi:hypothetical protein
VPDDAESPNLEARIASAVHRRLRRDLFWTLALTVALGAFLGFTLGVGYRSIRDLTADRLSEYQLLVDDKRDELLELDREEVARRTFTPQRCETGLDKADARELLRAERGEEPQGSEVRALVERASEFALCTPDAVRRVWDDPVRMASVDTVFRVLLHRPSDPVGRLVYGVWLERGVEIEAVARDVMSSEEFRKLKKLSP